MIHLQVDVGVDVNIGTTISASLTSLAPTLTTMVSALCARPCSCPLPTLTNAIQPKQVFEIKDFLIAARRKDARSVTIKKQTSGALKFKVRCSKYLYTLVVKDSEKAEKLQKSLPPGTSHHYPTTRVLIFLTIRYTTGLQRKNIN